MIFDTVALSEPELVLVLIIHDTDDIFHFILPLILSKFVHSTVDHSPANWHSPRTHFSNALGQLLLVDLLRRSVSHLHREDMS